MSYSSNEIEIGRQALQYFHNEMIRVWNNDSDKENDYKISFQELIDFLNKKNNGFLGGFGFAIIESDLHDSQVNDAMEELASRCNGKIPAWSSFTNALLGKVGKLSFYDMGPAIIEVTKGTVRDIALGAEKVGNEVISTGSTLLKNAAWFIPAILGGGILLFVYLKGKK